MSDLIMAIRLWLALRLVCWASDLLPDHYTETSGALVGMIHAIFEDRAAELEERRQ